ncbi:MAG TPA: glycosyltransferase family 39 protein, partial [Streptosporangiaceae bacterium]
DRWWLAIIPAAVTLVVTLYQIGRPTLWQDEISTLSDVNRRLPDMFRLLGNIDAVHGTYYLIMWAVVRLGGTSAVALRVPSAVAMAVTAGGVALLGRRLVSTRAGLAAGLVFAALPQVSWYGQDAREIGMVAAVATVSSYLFVRVLDAAPGQRRRWLIGYGAALSLLGLLNLCALLLIPAHGLTLAVLHVRERRARSPRDLPLDEATSAGAAANSARPPTWGWLFAAVTAVATASPVIALGWQQRSQIAWLARPDMRSLAKIEKVIGPPWLCAAVLGIIAIAVLAGAIHGSSRLRADWPWRLTALCVPWLLLPLVLLLAASKVHPVFAPRYIVFCLPAAALLLGAGLAALGRVAAALAFALLVALALPAQAQARAPNGHGENLGRVSRILAAHAHSGDAVLFGNSYVRKIEIAYPAGFRSLRDISLGETALRLAEPSGSNVSAAVISQRLHTVTRLWAITIANHRSALPPVRRQGFSLVRHWTVTGYEINFYVRHTAAGP